MHKAYVKNSDDGYTLFIHQDVLGRIDAASSGNTYVALLGEAATDVWGGMENGGYRSRITQNREDVMTAYNLLQILEGGGAPGDSSVIASF